MIPVSEESLKLRWLAGARWWACLGLCLAFGIGRWGLGFSLEVEPFAEILLMLVGTNLFLYTLTVPASDRLIAATILADVVLFTTMLYFYGGSANPLSSIYFLYVILASILMRPAWAWTVATLCSLCFASLFFSFLPIAELAGGHIHHHHGFSTHLQGMLITFVFTSYVIVYFITRLTSALRARESILEDLREKNRRSERLAGLTTLAAGAAHELRNPLGAISVSIKEVERELQASPAHAELLVEVESVNVAIQRCQRIIDDLCRNAGVVGGEPITTTSIHELMERLLGHLPRREMCTVTVAEAFGEGSFKTFASSLVQALLSLVRNGLEYGDVVMDVQRIGKSIRFSVRDVGPGISPDILPRLGEPFFSTKGAGKGMGLGLFIAKTFAERLGGSLTFDSTSPQGTIVTLSIPDLA